MLNYAQAHDGLAPLVKEAGGESTREYLSAAEIADLIRTTLGTDIVESFQDLHEAGLARIVAQLQKHPELREEMEAHGVSIRLRKKQNYWSKERVLAAAKEVFEMHGKLTHALLVQEGHGGASAFIQRTPGGMRRVKSLLAAEREPGR